MGFADNCSKIYPRTELNIAALGDGLGNAVSIIPMKKIIP